MGNLHEKSKLAHSGFYLTLVSIIQSLALGYLLQTLSTSILENGAIPIKAAVQSLTAFLMILVVWHEYAIGTIAFRWALSVFDSAIPFVLGVTQYFVLSAISIPETGKPWSYCKDAVWWWALTAFTLSGMGAYWNQSRKAELDVDQASLIKVPGKNLKHAMAIAALFCIVAIVLTIFPAVRSISTPLAFVSLAVFIGQALRVNAAYGKAPVN